MTLNVVGSRDFSVVCSFLLGKPDADDVRLTPYEGRMITHLAMVQKKRGNPNWGKPLPSPPCQPSSKAWLYAWVSRRKPTAVQVNCESSVSAMVTAAMYRNGC